MKKTTKPVKEVAVEEIQVEEVVPEQDVVSHSRELKAAAYDIQIEIQRLSNVLRQIQERLQTLNKN